MVKMNKTHSPDGKVWIDVTDLMAWKGHFSGIQRVVYAYALRYREHGAHYFSYNKNLNKFITVDPSRLFDEQGMLSQKKIRKSTKEKVRSVYKSVLPTPARKYTTPVARTVLSRVYKSRSALYGSRRAKVPFEPGDTVIIMGAAWESGSMIQQLRLNKPQTKFRLVHLWHDFLPLMRPHLFDAQLYARQFMYTMDALKLSDKTVTVSKATKRDIITFAKENKVAIHGDISVIREGEDSFTVIDPIKPKEITGSAPFILALGTIEVRKNHTLLYQAYKLAQERHVSLPKLVIVGRKGWLAEDMYYLLKNDADIQKDITVLTNASDAEVAWLLGNCMFTVFPSVCEGWGLPICESLCHGKLPLTCNVSSMPEVGGDLAVYFSPYNSEECLQAISKYAHNTDELRKREEKIKKSFKLTTWDKSFEAFRSVVETA